MALASERGFSHRHRARRGLIMFDRAAWRIGRKIYCNARGEQQSGDMSANGEAFLQKCVLSNAPPDDELIVLDIGANQGEWTASLLKQADEMRVRVDGLKIHAFEPVPSTASMFRDSMARIPGQDRVMLHNVALSSASGETEMAVYADGAGTNTLHFKSEGREPERTETVRLLRLDDFKRAENLAYIHLAKCDTEGHDVSVLQGANETLRAGAIGIIQFEYNHRWVYSRSFLKDVFELIDGLDYTLARVDPKRLTAFETWHPELDRFFQSNYALVHKAVEHWVPIHFGTFDGSNTYG